MSDLQNTPRSNRLHIGIFGRTNSGKSSLMNALINQDYAIVSESSGTTTDPVYKSMEIHGIGPVAFIDTAGFSDKTELGKVRLEKTELALKKTDVAILVFAPDAAGNDFQDERDWAAQFKRTNKPFVPVLNKTDLLGGENAAERLSSAIEKIAGEKPVLVSAAEKKGVQSVIEAVKRKIPEDFGAALLTQGLCDDGDLVLLVMPQDIQAPKGRLILPQVQILRELLDRKCIVQSCVTNSLEQALAALSRAPDLIITDSQVFKTVHDKKPAASKLTSFSVLLAASKGKIRDFVSGAEGIARLNGNSRVLIAEACTHAPLTEDIGREKIPRMLRKLVEEKKAGDGEKLQIDIVSGTNFPKDLSPYSLVIHCGGCMFNRAYVLSRQDAANAANVPMTNYGITIAYLSGILDKIALPETA